ncbi:MAG: hypothetical protein HYX90_10415 [Chloroflexi bacterium]|nr:hypothetical protein [Chloroflexota bacterium]
MLRSFLSPFSSLSPSSIVLAENTYFFALAISVASFPSVLYSGDSYTATGADCGRLGAAWVGVA